MLTKVELKSNIFDGNPTQNPDDIGAYLKNKNLKNTSITYIITNKVWGRGDSCKKFDKDNKGLKNRVNMSVKREVG